MRIDNLAEKILSFGQKINIITLRPYQLERALQFIKAIIHEDFSGTLSTLWARKSGKSDTLKVIISSLLAVIPELAKTNLSREFPRLRLYRNGLSVAFAGPKERQAKIPFVRLRRQAKQQIFRDALSSLDLKIETSNTNQFELSNGSVATAYSGSETASNEGPEAHCLIIDEAQGLSPFSVYKILRPMVAAVDGLISETGTPGRKRCPFLTDIEYNLRNAPQFHQQVPYDQVTPYSRWYASHISKELDRLPGGENNPFFRMNYKLEWLIAEGHFVEETFLKLNTGKRGTAGGRLTAGVDWGKVDSSTTITILEDRGSRIGVADLLLIKGDWDDQFDSIIPFLKKYNWTKLYAEENGVGDPLVSRLYREFGRVRVVGKFMSAQYKDHIFTKLDTELKAKPDQRFEYFDDGSIESKAFSQQFLDAEQEIRGGLLSVHKSEDEGSADDFLISTALATDAMLSSSSSTTRGMQVTVSAKKRGLASSLSNF